MSVFEIGAVIGPMVIDTVSADSMKTVAALMNDSNPIHWRPEVAATLGYGDRVVNQGPVTASYMLSVAVRAAGHADRVQRFDVRFLANVFAGDRVECRGIVTSIDSYSHVASVEIVARVEETIVAKALAQLRLPR